MKHSYSMLTLLIIFLMFFNFTVFGESLSFNTDSPTVIPIMINQSVLPDELFQSVFESANKHSNIENSEGLIGLKNNEQIMFATVRNGTFLIDKAAFDTVPEKNRVRAFHFFMKSLESMENNQNKDEIELFMTYLQESDDDIARVIFLSIYSEIKGDLYTAYTVVNPFMYVMNIFLGVGAVLLICLLLFSTLMDLCYLGFSYFTDGIVNFFVSYDAKQVEHEYQKRVNGEYMNKYLEYFKSRSLTYIVLAICITYLICGGLSGIIAFVLSLVNG